MFAPGAEADTGGSAEAQGGAGGVAPGHAGNDGTRGGQQHPQHTSQSVQQGDIIAIVMCVYQSFTLITSDPSSVPLSQSPRTTVQRPPPRAETMLLKKRD